MKKTVAVTTLFVLLVAAWAVLLNTLRSCETVLFPTSVYELFGQTDNEMGGFSTCQIKKTDSSIVAEVNIHSGMAYPYAGIGFNLMSVNNRPAVDFFDFSNFDSVEIAVETGRMRNITVRILTDDPVYSKGGVYGSYRPIQKSLPVVDGRLKFSIHDLKVPDRWFAARGLEEDDGQKHFQRGVIFEVLNGEGTMLGIPDEITLKGVKLWGEKQNFVTMMYFVLGVVSLLWMTALVYLRRRK